MRLLPVIINIFDDFVLTTQDPMLEPSARCCPGTLSPQPGGQPRLGQRWGAQVRIFLIEPPKKGDNPFAKVEAEREENMGQDS